MSLDVSDPRILQQYHSLQSTDSPIDWSSFGYKETSNKLYSYACGSGGVEELGNSLSPKEVQYGFVKVEGRIVLFSLIPESTNGVKRARALVHSRTLTSIFRSHHAIFQATSPSDFQLARIRSLLRLPPLAQLSISNSISSRRGGAHSRQVSASSPSASTLDQSIVSNTSTVQPSRTTPAAAVVVQEGKGKEKAPGQQDLPQFDLYHEYEDTSPSPSPAQPQRVSPPIQKYENEGEEEDTPPELPEKPPSPYLSQPVSSQTQSRSTSPSPLQQHRTSLSPPPSATNQPHQVIATTTTPFGTHQGLPPLSAPISAPPPHALNPAEDENDQPYSSTHSSTRNPRPFSESPAARMMLSPHQRDSRFDTIYHSAENDDEDEDEVEREENKLPISTRELDDHRREEEQGLGANMNQDEEGEADGIFDSYGGGEEGEDRVEEDEARRAEAEQLEIEKERERMRFEEVEMIKRREVERKEREEREVRESEEKLRRELEAQEEVERLRRAELEELERLRLQREKEERNRIAEEEQAELNRKAKEEMRLMVEREKLEKKLREEEEMRRREIEKQQLWERKRKDLIDKRDRGEVMLSGEVSVQGRGSMLWRRRYYELRGTAVSFFKNQAESTKPLDTVLTSSITSIISHPDEPLPPHSFKVLLQDEGDEYLLYGDDEQQKERLIEGLKIATRL